MHRRRRLWCTEPWKIQRGRAMLDTVESRSCIGMTRHPPSLCELRRDKPACPPQADWCGACAVLWARPADSVSAGIAGDTCKLRSRQRLHWGRWRGTWLQASCVSNAGSCAMAGGGLQDDCRRTAPAGHGGENALRICIFCDMSGRSQATPRWLQVGRRDWGAMSSWRTFWLQAESVTAAAVRR